MRGVAIFLLARQVRGARVLVAFRAQLLYRTSGTSVRIDREKRSPLSTVFPLLVQAVSAASVSSGNAPVFGTKRTEPPEFGSFYSPIREIFILQVIETTGEIKRSKPYKV